MIKILQRYIAKIIFQACGMSALIITSVVFLMMVLGELKNIGEGDYGLLQALAYVFMRLPSEVYHFSPILIMLGSIMGLSALTAHKELAVMRASGFSVRQIMLSVLVAALVLILGISIVGEVVGPGLTYKAEVRKENARSGGQSVVTAAGVWFHVQNSFIHVENVVGRQLLEGVTRYELDAKHRLQAAYFAKTLSRQNDKWMMHDVVKTVFLGDRTKSQSYPQVEWDLKFNPNLLNVGLVEPNEMSLSKLAKFSRYLKQNGLQASEYQFEFWQRVLQPFASLIMIVLSIIFVLGAMSSSTMGWRIIVGLMVGFAFFICNALLGQICIVYQVPAIAAALTPILIFAAFSYFLTRYIVKR